MLFPPSQGSCSVLLSMQCPVTAISCVIHFLYFNDGVYLLPITLSWMELEELKNKKYNYMSKNDLIIKGKISQLLKS